MFDTQTLFIAILGISGIRITDFLQMKVGGVEGVRVMGGVGWGAVTPFIYSVTTKVSVASHKSELCAHFEAYFEG